MIPRADRLRLVTEAGSLDPSPRMSPRELRARVLLVLACVAGIAAILRWQP